MNAPPTLVPRDMATDLLAQIGPALGSGNRAAFDDAFADDDFDLALAVLVQVVDAGSLSVDPALLAAARDYAAHFLG